MPLAKEESLVPSFVRSQDQRWQLSIYPSIIHLELLVYGRSPWLGLGKDQKLEGHQGLTLSPYVPLSPTQGLRIDVEAGS
jgi:hypothetical protein